MFRPFSQMEEIEVVTALVSPLLALRIKILHFAIQDASLGWYKYYDALSKREQGK